MKEISYLKILVPTAGPIPARERAADVIHIARKLKAEVVAMHILTAENARDHIKRDEGTEALDIFDNEAVKHGVKLTKLLHEGELVPSIINTAESENFDLIVMGAGEDQIVAEWIISDLKEKTSVPVVVIPHGFTTIL